MEHMVETEVENKVRENIFKKFAFKDENSNKTYKSFEKEYIRIADFGWTKENPFIDFHERIKLVYEISLYYENETDVENILSYDEFKKNINSDITTKAKDRVRKNLPNVAKGIAKRETIILVLFVMEARIADANAYLNLFNMDILYTRNIYESLIYYYLKKRNEKNDSPKCNKEDLYNDYSKIIVFTNEYKKYVLNGLGKEFSDLIIELKNKSNKDYDPGEADIIEENFKQKNKSVILYRRSDKTSHFLSKGIRKKGTKLSEYLILLNESTKNYTQLSDEYKTIKTTTYLNEELIRIKDETDIKKMIEENVLSWCTYRNKPLKKLIIAMNDMPNKNKISLNKFIYDLFAFYCVKICVENKEEKYISLLLKSKDERKVGEGKDKKTNYFSITKDGKEKSLKQMIRSIYDSYWFQRVFLPYFLGFNPTSKAVFVTMFLFICNKNNKIPTLGDLNKFLSECGYLTIGEDETTYSELDKFVKCWIEIYNEGKSNISFQDSLAEACKQYITDFDSPESPLSWI